MKKKLVVVCVTILVFMFCCSSYASEDLSFLDDSNQVIELKQNLYLAGYLGADEAKISIYNKATKEAVTSLQRDLGLEESGIATREMQVIANLLAKLSVPGQNTPTPQPKQTLPDLKNLQEDDATSYLRQLSLLPIIASEYNDLVEDGRVIRSSPIHGTEFKDGDRITLFISRGPKFIQSTQSTWYAWWLKGSRKDDYELTNPYIDDGYLYIELVATLNSSYKYTWRGYGTAAINDSFDKVVPLSYTYENEVIKKGESQKIVLKIPISDLNVQRPTTLSVKIELYRNKTTEDRIRMDFTMSW